MALGDDLLGVEGALALGPRIANEAGGASHQRQRVVPRHLQVAHHLDGDQMAVVKARSSRVEAAIEGELAIGQRGAKRVDVSVLSNESPPLQLIQDVGHCPAYLPRFLPAPRAEPDVPRRR